LIVLHSTYLYFESIVTVPINQCANKNSVKMQCKGFKARRSGAGAGQPGGTQFNRLLQSSVCSQRAPAGTPEIAAIRADLSAISPPNSSAGHFPISLNIVGSALNAAASS
jgi:hypothetical protein